MRALAFCYYKRFEKHGSQNDLEQAASLLMESVEITNAPPRDQLTSMMEAARMLMLFEPPRWNDLSRVTEAAVRLLPLVSTRALKQTDQQHALRQFGGLAGFAAAVALQMKKEPSHAVELLESGRGVIMGLRFETQTDLTQLRRTAEGAKLAARFEHLRDQLDADTLTPGAVIGPLSSMPRVNRHNVQREFEILKEDIRRLPKFANFLKPLEASKLMEAAAWGPIVVINVSFRCDALLVRTSGISKLPLSPQFYSQISETVNNSSSVHSSTTLQLLWDMLARPVLDYLGFRAAPKDNEAPPRIWWVSTDWLTRLPLHAAGYHRPGSSQTVIDRVVSSYSPSIKALIHARERRQGDCLDTASGTALLISMDKTPDISNAGLYDLKYTEDEVEIVSSLVPEDMPRVQLPEPNKDKVLAQLDKCAVFHFAGHGTSHPVDPSKGCLLLTDWLENPLTVVDLTGLRLYQNPPWLAYLSACSTGENQAQGLLDETIHLMSACQLAGFQHVIGSLWTIDDKYSVDTAREVYDTMKRSEWAGDAVARGIRNAALRLREMIRVEHQRAFRDVQRAMLGEIDAETETISDIRGAGKARWHEYETSVWAAYIHVGP
jgi:CHAT domain-containing protein